MLELAMRMCVFASLTVLGFGCVTFDEEGELGYDDIEERADVVNPASISVGDSFILTEVDFSWASATNSYHNVGFDMSKCVIKRGAFVTVEGGDDQEKIVMLEYCHDSSGTTCPTGIILEVSRGDLESNFTRADSPSFSSTVGEVLDIGGDAWLHETEGNDCMISSGEVEIKRIYPHCNAALVVYTAPWLGGGGATACSDGAQGTVRLDKIETWR